MSANFSLVRKKDLTDNPTARVPVCLCLDTSGSMNSRDTENGNSRIDELQNGVDLFYRSIQDDEVAVYSAEICIVEFNSHAKCLIDFANINRQSERPKLTASGNTFMGEGVNLALDLLNQRKAEYKDAGVDYFQPWLVLMSDGDSNGDAAELARSIGRTVELVLNKRLTVFPIAIGKDADIELLSRYSPNRTPLRLKEMRFCEFFSWLSKSIVKTSQSTPGEKLFLDMDGVKGWAEL